MCVVKGREMSACRRRPGRTNKDYSLYILTTCTYYFNRHHDEAAVSTTVLGFFLGTERLHSMGEADIFTEVWKETAKTKGSFFLAFKIPSVYLYHPFSFQAFSWEESVLHRNMGRLPCPYYEFFSI